MMNLSNKCYLECSNCTMFLNLSLIVLIETLPKGFVSGIYSDILHVTFLLMLQNE